MAFVIDGSGKVHHGDFFSYMEAKLAALTEDAPETAPAGKRAVAARYFEQQHGAAPAVTAVEAPELPERVEPVATGPETLAQRIAATAARQVR